MQILHDYPTYSEPRLANRYITLSHIEPLLQGYKNRFEISSIGTSENGLQIPMVSIGNGKKVILAWSQMHGNESTTTKALFDVFSLMGQKLRYQTEVAAFFSEYTWHVIPILNPDGAMVYTRENANGIDLNRDAQQRSQSESKALFYAFTSLQPDLCLNLHDQRTIYGLQNGKPATLSFLAPAADPTRTVTPARKTAMKEIGAMAKMLEMFLPGQIGRYDDTFNVNCVGDSFQLQGVPTILFEAGHYHNDYAREHTRKYVCFALLSLFGFLVDKKDIKPYTAIPKNLKNYNDIVIRNVKEGATGEMVAIALQYREVLHDTTVMFEPYIDSVGKLPYGLGHLEIDANGASVLINSQENYGVGTKVSIIINKEDKSVIFINKNSFQ